MTARAAKAIAVATLLLLTGCAGDAHLDFVYNYTPSSPQLAGTTPEHLFIATTRAPAKDARRMYSGERSDMTHYAGIDVSIPANHTPGEVERPSSGKADPRKNFVAYDPNYFTNGTAFTKAIDTALASRPPGSRRILVFVHGFNNSFDEAVLRFAQITHDASFDGVAVLFTWASRGSALNYLYDRDSATAARDAFERTLKQIAAHTRARRIDILAHSMGTWLTMETLRQIRIANERSLSAKIGDVVLAAPDISVDVFKTQMKRYGRPDKPFYVLISRDDRALAVSRRIAGNTDRVGDYKNDRELAGLGLTVVDLSDVDSAGDRTRHSKFASNPQLVRLLGSALRARRTLDSTAQNDDLDAQVAAVGKGIGNAVGSVAGLVITAPIRILTAPLKIVGE